eukprot:2848985-Rhodomonas_salina.1
MSGPDIEQRTPRKIGDATCGPAAIGLLMPLLKLPFTVLLKLGCVSSGRRVCVRATGECPSELLPGLCTSTISSRGMQIMT